MLKLGFESEAGRGAITRLLHIINFNIDVAVYEAYGCLVRIVKKGIITTKRGFGYEIAIQGGSWNLGAEFSCPVDTTMA